MARTFKGVLREKQVKNVIQSGDESCESDLHKESFCQRQKKKSKKITDEDTNEVDVDFDNLTGGAVLSKHIRTIEAETKRPYYEDLGVIKESFMSYAPRATNPFLVTAIDALSLIPANHISFDQMEPSLQAVSEKEVHKALMDGVTGKGARFDHPVIARSVIESLASAPAVLHAYTRGRVPA